MAPGATPRLHGVTREEEGARQWAPRPQRCGAGWELGGGSARRERERGGHFVPSSLASVRGCWGHCGSGGKTSAVFFPYRSEAPPPSPWAVRRRSSWSLGAGILRCGTRRVWERGGGTAWRCRVSVPTYPVLPPAPHCRDRALAFSLPQLRFGSVLGLVSFPSSSARGWGLVRVLPLLSTPRPSPSAHVSLAWGVAAGLMSDLWSQGRPQSPGLLSLALLWPGPTGLLGSWGKWRIVFIYWGKDLNGRKLPLINTVTREVGRMWLKETCKNFFFEGQRGFILVIVASKSCIISRYLEILVHFHSITPLQSPFYWRGLGCRWCFCPV